MNLAELTAYAKEKHDIAEQHPWADKPGLSVLIDPVTGKWVALLMRQWDTRLGCMVERCDIKCGQEILADAPAPYLSPPFRMRDHKWVGVGFDSTTNPDVVCRLLDKAMESGAEYGCKVVLGNEFLAQNSEYQETLLPFDRPHAIERKPANHTSDAVTKTISNQPIEKLLPFDDAPDPARKKQASVDAARAKLEHLLQNSSSLISLGPKENNNPVSTPQKTAKYEETRIPANSFRARYRAMRDLYESGDGSFELKARNFYVQGKYMEDYEPEDVAGGWFGDVSYYFPTYHNLTAEQLRSYFVWRRDVRNGFYRDICNSAAYIYLYELVNEIGTSSVRDSIEKLNAFEAGFLNEGHGDLAMRRNLLRWKFELAVLHLRNGLTQDEVLACADPATRLRDASLAVLQSPDDHSDQDVFMALVEFGTKLPGSSAVFQKKPLEGVHLFAETWRTGIKIFSKYGKKLFDLCFGAVQTYPWHPLSNAVYYKRQKQAPVELVLNECRKYSFDGMRWTEHCCHELNFNKVRLNALLRETDRKLRLYLKLGHPLQARKEEAWASGIVDAVIENDRTMKLDAAKPKVNISFSDLDRIRQDALETRDRLLTEDDRGFDTEAPSLALQPTQALTSHEIQNAVSDIQPEETQTLTTPPAEQAPVPDIEIRREHSFEAVTPEPLVPLDVFQCQLLEMLLRGVSVKDIIRSHHGLPEVIADTLNELLFDEIGDSAVECDGDELALVEDYRDDIRRILGGDTQ